MKGNWARTMSAHPAFQLQYMARGTDACKAACRRLESHSLDRPAGRQIGMGPSCARMCPSLSAQKIHFLERAPPVVLIHHELPRTHSSGPPPPPHKASCPHVPLLLHSSVLLAPAAGRATRLPSRCCCRDGWRCRGRRDTVAIAAPGISHCLCQR